VFPLVPKLRTEEEEGNRRGPVMREPWDRISWQKLCFAVRGESKIAPATHVPASKLSFPQQRVLPKPRFENEAKMEYARTSVESIGDLQFVDTVSVPLQIGLTLLSENAARSIILVNHF